MRVLGFPAFEGFQLALPAVDCVVGVDGDGVEGAGANGCVGACRFDDDVWGSPGLVMDYVYGIGWLGG